LSPASSPACCSHQTSPPKPYHAHPSAASPSTRQTLPYTVCSTRLCVKARLGYPPITALLCNYQFVPSRHDLSSSCSPPTLVKLVHHPTPGASAEQAASLNLTFVYTSVKYSPLALYADLPEHNTAETILSKERVCAARVEAARLYLRQ